MRIKVCELIEMLKKIDSETSIEISSDLEKILCFFIYDNRRPLSGADLDKLLKEHWSFPRLPEETDEKYMERFSNHILGPRVLDYLWIK